MYQESNLHHMKVSSRMIKMTYCLVIVKKNLRKMLQSVVQDYQTKRLTFNNLSLSSIRQLRFLKYFMFEWFDLSMRIEKKTILSSEVFMNFPYLLSFYESYFHNIFFFFIISILKRSSLQFFFDFNPSVFAGITGLT